MFDLYKRIWMATGRSQVLLLLLSALVAAIAAVPLDYQKQIINGLDGDLDTSGLIRLCLEMSAVILVSLG
ncbi:MAG: ABC transporter ATP-binding protein, partial [Pseudomonadota bacterium]